MALFIGIPKFKDQFEPVRISEALIDEIEALNAIYGEGTFHVLHAHKSKIRGNVKIPGEESPVQLWFPSDYPSKPPTVHAIDASLHEAASLRTKKLLLLYHSLLRQTFSIGNVCVFDFIETVQPYIECMTNDGFDVDTASQTIPGFNANDYRWMQRRSFPDQDPAEVVEWTICFDELHSFKAVPVPCGHYFCMDCLEAGWQSATTSMEPLTCCLQRIPIRIVQETFEVDAEKLKQYERMLLIRDTPYPFFCGILRCNELIGSFNENALRKRSVRQLGVSCRRCGTYTCAKCRTAAHRGAPCLTDDNLNTVFQEADIRRCPKCQNGIQKNGGCSHMHCRACDSHWWWMDDGSMRPYKL